MPYCITKFDEKGDLKVRICSDKDTNPFPQSGSVVSVKDCKDCPPFPPPQDPELSDNLKKLIGLIEKLIEKLK